MEPPDTQTPTVTIGGREVTHLEAALIAQKADRLGVCPSAVGKVRFPRRTPKEVVLSGYRLTLATAATIAATADARGVPPVRVIESIAEEYAEQLNRKTPKRRGGGRRG
jgi:hypothetical protein